MKDFDVVYKDAQLPRAIKLMAKHDNICAYNWIKTAERLEIGLFSLPFTIFTGLRVFYVPQYTHIPKAVLSTTGKIKSLSDLLNQNKVLGLVKGRSYGEILDN